MSDNPEGLYERLLFTLFAAGAGIMVLATLLILYDLLARNLNLTPFAHTIALTEYGLYYMALLGAPWLARKKHHIYIQILATLVSTRIRPVIIGACCFLCTITCAVICFYAGLVTLESFVRGDYEVRSFDMPRWILFAIMPVSFFLLTLEFGRYLFGFDSMYDSEPGFHE